MTLLVDLADVLRSKNAGPFQVTIDAFFPDEEIYLRVLESHVLSPPNFGRLFSVPPESVQFFPIRRLFAIKVTYDRPGPSSGAPGDRDVYGAQQHGPLLSVEVP